MRVRASATLTVQGVAWDSHYSFTEGNVGLPGLGARVAGLEKGFDLSDNPFAVLGATPSARLEELQALAASIGTTQAATAARVLSLPRSRLPAELAFLPGSAATTTIVLGALRQGMRPDPAILTPFARANVVAHLCAAGVASEGEQDRLALLQPAPGDAALADAIDGDRALARMPPVQRPAMAAEQEALADRHAAALVFACRTAASPAVRLAQLVRRAPDGTPSGFMRRVASAWTRHSVAELARVEEDATEAERALLRIPEAAGMGRLVAAVQAWAALTAPQRASDARAGLDSPAALRMVRAWRTAGVRLADDGYPDLALLLARALAACFADLPGEAARLADDVRDCAGRAEEQGLEPRLAPLRALTQRLAATDLAILTNDLAKAPFGPGARGVAAELWAAFDAAAAACVQSEAPWTIVRDLAGRLGGEHKMSGAAPALALHRGMAARADAAGFTTLAVRLRAAERGLERAAAVWRYVEAADTAKQAGHVGLMRRRRALVALRAALPLVDGPAERATLVADEHKLLRNRRNAVFGWLALSAFVVAIGGAWQLDASYSAQAPYRRAAPQSLVPIPEPAAPNPDLSASAVPDTRPAPAPPIPTLVDPNARVGGAKEFKAMTPVFLPHLAFPTHTALPERQPPGNTGRVRTLPEVRWCEFNKVRLRAALDAATDTQEPAVRALGQDWMAVCETYPNTRRDEDRVAGEVERFRGRLETEGRAMLDTATLDGASP